MKIRSIEYSDLDELKRIHDLYFKDEFHLPDFFNYLCAFVVEDDRGIITFGGLRDIPECVTVTNKSRDVMDRVNALHWILDASINISKGFSYDQIYVWSQNPSWYNILRRNGFRPPQGQSLILDL